MTAIVIVTLIILFLGAIISPHWGGKIQRKANQKASWLKRASNWLWDPLAWWAKSGLEFTRRSILVVADWGKKLRDKLPF